MEDFENICMLETKGHIVPRACDVTQNK